MARPLGLGSVRILSALHDGAAYGLELVTVTGLPSGTVYPALSRMKRSGLVRARWEDQREAEREGRPRRRYYELTPEGAGALAEALARMRALVGDAGAGSVGAG